MIDHARDRDTAVWLQKEFGGDYPVFTVPMPGVGRSQALSWVKVQRHLAKLVKEDRFFTDVEQDNQDNIDTDYIRERLAESGIVNGELVDPEALDRDPFIRQILADAERVAQEEQTSPPDLSGQPVTRTGDTITIGSGDASHEVDVTLSDEQWAAVQQKIPESAAIPLPYKVGDTVYLDNTLFEITNIGSYTVVDGKVYYRENSRMVRPELNETAKARVIGMVELRDCVQKLITQQLDEYASDAEIRKTQAELNRLYDAFTAKYGLINSRGNNLAFAEDRGRQSRLCNH